jgi:DNA-binding transcriptional ArsR family regulator
MSHYMTALAMRQVGLKPAAKIVLYWLADHHNETTGACFPSIGRLAELCEMSRRSVENHLADMEAAGLIKRQPRHRETGGKASNGYILLFAESDAQNLRIGSAKSAHGVCAKSAHVITLEDTNLGKEPLSIDVVSVFSAYNEVAQRVGWPLISKQSKARENAARQRMKDCGGFDNWKAAIERAAASDFLSGKATGTTPATFDWLTKAANFTKLMEGNYDNRANNTAGNSNANTAALEMAFAARARRTPSQDCF